MTTSEYAQEYVERGADRVGLQIYSEPRPGAPIVIIWPAMGVPARYYRPLAEQLRATGTGVIVADLRGTGASTPRPSRASRYGLADLAADVGAVLTALKPRLDGHPVLLLGHSLGGQACVLHLARVAATGTGPDEPSVDGLVLVAVGLPWFQRYPGPRRFGVLAFTQAIAGIAATLRVWPGWGFGGRQARGVMRDWGYTARTGRFPRLGELDTERALRQIATPTLVLSVDDDQYTPAGVVDHLSEKLSAATVVREHVTTAQAGVPLDHFRWVRASSVIAQRIAAFAASIDRTRRTHPSELR